MTKELVTRWFNKISNEEKNMPLLVLNGLAYTPRQTFDEVMRGSEIGEKLQNLIEQGRFGTALSDEKALIKERLRLSWQSKPQTQIKFVALPTSGLPVKAYTYAEMLRELDKPNYGAVKQFADHEANYMRRIIQVR